MMIIPEDTHRYLLETCIASRNHFRILLTKNPSDLFAAIDFLGLSRTEMPSHEQAENICMENIVRLNKLIIILKAATDEVTKESNREDQETETPNNN